MQFARVVMMPGIVLAAILAPLSPEARALPQDVWIALRGDDRPGTGTRDDPFNAETAERLDGLMREIESNTNIHFGAGTFVTHGIQAKEGWRINGRGKDLTTLKLADGTATGGERTNYPVIAKFFEAVWLKYFELRDLTLDCNRENQPVFTNKQKGFALDAYLIAAKSAKITNVRVRGTWADPGEGFPCMIMHDGTSGNDDRIEICGVENLNPIGYLTAISVLDQSGGSISGFIRNCLVTDHKDGSAFGSGGWRDFEVSNNRTSNVAIPIVIDTHNYRNVRIHGNRFRNCSAWGILANGGGVYDRLRIYRNLFEMGPVAGPVFLFDRATASVRIYRNRVVQPNPSGGIIRGSPKVTGRFHDNEIQTAGPFETNTVQNLAVFGNCDVDGRVARPTFSRSRMIRPGRKSPKR